MRGNILLYQLNKVKDTEINLVGSLTTYRYRKQRMNISLQCQKLTIEQHGLTKEKFLLKKKNPNLPYILLTWKPLEQLFREINKGKDLVRQLFPH